MVDDAGIWVVYPNGTAGFPWPEITGVAVYVSLLPPDDQRVMAMDVGHVSGEYLDIGETTEGFQAAVSAIAARAGRAAPDLSPLRLSDGYVEIYPARAG